MAAVDDTEINNIMFKAEDWMTRVMDQFGCEEPIHITSVLFKNVLTKRTLNLEDKEKFAAFFSESFHLVRFQNDNLKKMKNRLSSIKDQLIENQKLVISAQESIIDCKEKQLQKQLQAVQTVVKDTVVSQFKSYSDTVQENVMVCQPESSVTAETLKEVVKSVVQAEDRSKNIMIFGLPEDSSKDLNKTVEELFEEIGLKPAMELSRVGKSKEKTTRPVKVTLSSSSTAYQIISQARKLRQSEKFSSVFISPDRSLEDRVKHRLLVQNLHKKKEAEPNKHHYIKGGTIHTEDKSVR